MGQARTLNEKELNLLLLYINTKKHAARDRAMVLMTYWGGMRIGEVAATKVGDVLAVDGATALQRCVERRCSVTDPPNPQSLSSKSP